MAVGSFWDAASDAWDATGGKVVHAATDLGSSVIDNIPGGNALSGALKDLVNGPLRDFANTAVGKVVLTAIASTFYGSAVWYVGPQLASVAFAVPGLAKGDDFTTAYLGGVRDRAEQLLQIIAPGMPGLDIFGDQVTKALKAFISDYAAQKIVETAEQLAAKYGIRVDAAEYAKAIWNEAPLPNASRFGLDGNRLPAGTSSASGLLKPSKVSQASAPPRYTTSAASTILQRSKVATLFSSPPPAPTAPSAPSVDRSTAPPVPSGPSAALLVGGAVAGVAVLGTVAWLALRQ